MFFYYLGTWKKYLAVNALTESMRTKFWPVLLYYHHGFNVFSSRVVSHGVVVSLQKPPHWAAVVLSYLTAHRLAKSEAFHHMENLFLFLLNQNLSGWKFVSIFKTPGLNSVQELEMCAL